MVIFCFVAQYFLEIQAIGSEDFLLFGVGVIDAHAGVVDDKLIIIPAEYGLKLLWGDHEVKFVPSICEVHGSRDIEGAGFR